MPCSSLHRISYETNLRHVENNYCTLSSVQLGTTAAAYACLLDLPSYIRPHNRQRKTLILLVTSLNDFLRLSHFLNRQICSDAAPQPGGAEQGEDIRPCRPKANWLRIFPLIDAFHPFFPASVEEYISLPHELNREPPTRDIVSANKMPDVK